MSLIAESVPAASTEEVRDAVRESAAHGIGQRIIGAGSWLDAGRPVRATRTLRVSGLRGIVDYCPGDLTLTARAGTTLAEIAAATAAENQWLALDPPGTADGTLGATVATASTGPLSYAYGGPRDQVLGIEAVTGTGAVIRAGGRVVKNVAGFDLTRLFTGSWGTLGVITEATVRLRARPERITSYILPLPDDADRLASTLRAIRAAPLAPIAMECCSPALARTLFQSDSSVLFVRLAGNDTVVEAQRAALAAFGDVHATADDRWDALRIVEPSAAAVMRLSRAPASFVGCWGAALSLHPAIMAHGSPGRGVVRCILPVGDPRDALRLVEKARRFRGSVIVERLPATAWEQAVVPSAMDDRLSRAVKERFDPMHVLNPGILGSVA